GVPDVGGEGFCKKGQGRGGRGGALLWHPGKSGELSGWGVCRLSPPAWVRPRGQAVVPARSVVDGRVCGPPYPVQRARGADVSEQTPVGGGHVRGYGA